MQYVYFRLTTNILGHFHSFGKIINKDFITNSLHPFQLKHKLTLLFILDILILDFLKRALI
jgi:hypothetical protein